jgi:lipopolysaccharide/colanic/teichoic acid biosynthesis glycosyltransferase
MMRTGKIDPTLHVHKTIRSWRRLGAGRQSRRQAALKTNPASYRMSLQMLPMSINSLSVTQTPATHARPRAASRPRGRWVNGAGKRMLDFSLALLAILVAAPVLTLIALAIKLTSRGPVLFRQERMGMGGKPFTILKFRTMRVQEGPSVTARNDARITEVGRWLRRAKLDELPQIVNVLQGDMSLVGPRPKISDHQQSELICKPGLTGAATLAFIEEEKMLVSVPEAQLEAYVIDVLHRIKSDVDHEYALRSTLRSDLLLLASTVLHLFRIRRSHRVEAMNDRIRGSQPV